jgi:hypothetical protein
VERRSLPDDEGDVHQIVLRVIAHVVVHIRVEEAGAHVDVPQANHVALKLQRPEGMLDYRAEERQEGERPDNGAAPRGERDVRPQVLLLQQVIADEAEADLADLGRGADSAQRILRIERCGEADAEQGRGPHRLRTHNAPAATGWWEGCRREACCAASD